MPNKNTIYQDNEEATQTEGKWKATNANKAII